MKKILFLTVILTFLFTSCEENHVYHFKSQHFILGYYEMESIEVQPWQSGNFCKCDQVYALQLIPHTNGTKYFTYLATGEKYSKKKTEDATYLEYCKKHNDMSYNQTASNFWPTRTIDNSIIAEDFTKISIKSNADYDATHPAGTELGDIVEYIGASPYPYIVSGYKSLTAIPEERVAKSFFKQINPGGDDKNRTYHMIQKKANLLTAKELTMIGIINRYNESNFTLGLLNFPTLPTSEKIHVFTIEMTTDEGKTFSCKYEMDFN